jgi:chromosome partitioning protein
MSVYAIWNNKGGVGKSYLTFQIASQFAIAHPDQKVLVIDLCPQANSSSMLLGGMIDGEERLNEIHAIQPRLTISGYIEDRTVSPYISPKSGAKFITKVSKYNQNIPDNLFLVVGDERLEVQSSRVSGAAGANIGPEDSWRIVHLWIKDLIQDISHSWNYQTMTVFIDCNPSFSIYTELALTAAERLLIPFSADGSSKRAVKAVLSLVYGVRRNTGDQQSEFFLNFQRWKIAFPKIYMYIGNRLTQMNESSASAFKTVVDEIGNEIWAVWQSTPDWFCLHSSEQTPKNKRGFERMFCFEVSDANTASVVSGALGIPITKLTAGQKSISGRKKPSTVNQTQLDKQVPNIKELVNNIE